MLTPASCLLTPPRLSMARRTRSHVVRRANLVLLFQRRSDEQLRGVGVGYISLFGKWMIDGTPAQVRELLSRAEELFRLTVAVEAPGHAQRLHLADDVHLVDPPVTRDARNAMRDVRRVIEVSVL